MASTIYWGGIRMSGLLRVRKMPRKHPPMWGVNRLRCRCGLVLAVAASGAAAAGPTLSLKATKINGGNFSAPRASVTVKPGDVITAEIFAAHWSDEGASLRGYQAAVDLAAFDAGAVLPRGWDDPRPDLTCRSDADCPEGLTCLLVFDQPTICAGPNHDPGQGIFIDANRADNVFYGKAVAEVVDPIYYRFVQILLDPADCPLFDGMPKYCGTLVLVVSPDAAGTFAIPLLPSTGSIMRSCDEPEEDLTPLATEPLFISVPPGDWRITESVPSNCWVDTAEPSPPDGSAQLTRNAAALQIETTEMDTLAPTDFLMRVTPENRLFFPNSIIADEPEPTWVTVGFPPIVPGTWTCISFGVDEVCFGDLPGDVNGDRVAQGTDVTALHACLAGISGCPSSRCDLDRSGGCGAADILREVDLLIGAEKYQPWLGQRLPRCPSVVTPEP